VYTTSSRARATTLPVAIAPRLAVAFDKHLLLEVRPQ